MTKEEIDALAHGIAYSAACTMIESECCWRGTEGVGWFDVSIESFGDDDVIDSVKYLDARGLIERHPENSNWVRMRDESEAPAPAPLHPFNVRICIKGDDWDYVVRSLDELAVHIRDHGPECGMCSGGCGGSHSVDIQKRDVSAEQFRAELLAWFDARMEAKRVQ